MGKNKIKYFIIFVIVPMFIGGIIYVLFRPKSLLMFKWFNFLSISNLVEFVRIRLSQNKLPEWFIYSLPNGLWSFSTISFILILAKNKKIFIFWFSVCCVVIFLPEILQLTNIISGTFDIIDCFTNSLFMIIGFKLNFLRSCLHEKTC